MISIDPQMVYMLGVKTAPDNMEGIIIKKTMIRERKTDYAPTVENPI